ncbi:PIG-L deacetylase family protein [Microvirga roseola]|uniref:PIG-L deacetylase family protein n=1 Tax=Microvirga roseola TaxID=2883126 RepID=UPI001E4F278D|nr:PIG-L family deacetylase [Microvirga roseola]
MSPLSHLLVAPRGRAALIAAHPDDETIGVGGHLASIPDISILTVTDGAPADLADSRAAGCASRADYAALRRREMIAAMAVAGIGEERLECFGIGDQQASFEMTALAHRLADWMSDRGICLVMTHPYEMGHPDHDAVAFAVHAAAALLARDGQEPPRVVEFASYHRGGGGELATGLFASGADPGESIVLRAEAQTVKRRMLEVYRSQQRTLAPFGVDAERFRLAPSYCFTAPPHDNGAYFDSFAWGMRSDRWLGLAADALDSLGLR